MLFFICLLLQFFYRRNLPTSPPSNMCTESEKSSTPTDYHHHNMDNTQKFQIVYAGPTNLCQHSTTDLARGIMMNKRKQSVLSKARSFKHSKTTSSIFVFIYHQRTGKTRLCHMRVVDFTHFNTCCTFKKANSAIAQPQSCGQCKLVPVPQCVTVSPFSNSPGHGNFSEFAEP